MVEMVFDHIHKKRRSFIMKEQESKVVKSSTMTKEQLIAQSMKELGINENDLVEKTTTTRKTDSSLQATIRDKANKVIDKMLKEQFASNFFKIEAIEVVDEKKDRKATGKCKLVEHNGYRIVVENVTKDLDGKKVKGTLLLSPKFYLESAFVIDFNRKGTTNMTK